MKTLLLALAWSIASAGAGWTADRPLFRPPASWVKLQPIPKDDPDHAEGAAQVLLQTLQTRLGASGDETYSQTAIKILTAQGLADWGNVILSWRPDTQTLTIHHLNIIRNGQVIDLLGQGKKVVVLRRETNLEMAMLDGALTATVQPEGLRVGDIIDLATTIEEHDPVMKGRSESFVFLARPGTITHAYLRGVWPASKPLRWRATQGLEKVVPVDTPSGRELVFDMKEASAPPAPRGAPGRYNWLAALQMSDFASWAEVSTLSAPLYAKAATLSAQSPLHAEAKKIMEASPDPAARALAALKLVEEKVRYLYVGLGEGGYVPADADQTWTRRFGDCKAKTALLLALLKDFGIQAQPALVNTSRGDGLNERLPTMDAFDHVIVRATIAGKVYWLDGTRLGDVSLQALPIPNYSWALPVQEQGATLQKLEPEIYAEPHFERRVRIDASAGPNTPATVHIEDVFRGDEGLGIQLKLQSLSRVDLDRGLREYWRNAASWVQARQVTFTPDHGDGSVIAIDGAGMMDWSKEDAGRTFIVEDSRFGYEANFERDPGIDRDAPFQVAFPVHLKRTVSIVLPAAGAGFVLLNADPIDRIAAGVEYKREAKIQGAVATIEASQVSLAPEVSQHQASAATAILRYWGTHAVMLGLDNKTAQADRLSALCAAQDPKEAIAACTAALAPNSGASLPRADAFMRRGVAYAKTDDLDHAIEDYSAILQLKPDARDALLNRGSAYLARSQTLLALKDVDSVIRRFPTDGVALRERASVYINQREWALAIKDLDQALEINPADELALDVHGNALEQSGNLDEAIRDFDHALMLDAEDQYALNNRASIKSRKHDAAGAIADLTTVIELAPSNPVAYRNRGSVELLAHDPKAAIRDFDEVLHRKPDDGVALRLRGKAYIELGQIDLGIRDLDEAIRLSPKDSFTLNSRCWTRAKLGKDLELALADCNRSLDIAPGKTATLDSRALVYLRQGRDDLAVADASAALKIFPKLATSLYVRSLAERRLNRTAEAEADLAAAKALQADIIDTYAKMGVGPTEIAIAARGK